MATKSKGAATFDDLLVQLKMLNRLTAAQLRDKFKQNEFVELLASTGASNQEIADVLDTTADVVKVTLHRLKKSK
jgi:DNA-binding CsgD family transcriptional regulator